MSHHSHVTGHKESGRLETAADNLETVRRKVTMMKSGMQDNRVLLLCAQAGAQVPDRQL